MWLAGGQWPVNFSRDIPDVQAELHMQLQLFVRQGAALRLRINKNTSQSYTTYLHTGSTG